MQFYSMQKLPGFIFLRDALSIMAMHDGAGQFTPFSLTFVTCNLSKREGGRRVSAENVTLAGAPYGKKVSTKPANHFINGTRNVMIPGKARPTKIHNVLITRFNGETVII